MSLSKLSRNPPKPKYCKVCHDAGMEEKIYTSHYIRESPDPTSRVVCPTLLGLECKYCFKPGHTVKYCTTLKKKNKRENYKSNPKKSVQEPIPTQDAKNNNIYSLLDYGDNENDGLSLKKEEIQISEPTLTTPAVLSYRKIIDVTHQQILDEENQRLRRELLEQEQKRKREEDAKQQQKISSIQVVHQRFRKMSNWADDTSDEEEELSKFNNDKKTNMLNWADDTSDEEETEECY